MTAEILIALVNGVHKPQTKRVGSVFRIPGFYRSLSLFSVWHWKFNLILEVPLVRFVYKLDDIEASCVDGNVYMNIISLCVASLQARVW